MCAGDEEPTGRITGLSTVVHTYHLMAREAEGRKIEGLKARLGYNSKTLPGGKEEKKS